MEQEYVRVNVGDIIEVCSMYGDRVIRVATELEPLGGAPITQTPEGEMCVGWTATLRSPIVRILGRLKLEDVASGMSAFLDNGQQYPVEPLRERYDQGPIEWPALPLD